MGTDITKLIERAARWAVRGGRSRVLIALLAAAAFASVSGLAGRYPLVVIAGVIIWVSVEWVIRVADPADGQLVTLTGDLPGSTSIRLLALGGLAAGVSGGGRWALLALGVLAVVVALADAFNRYVWEPVVESARNTTASRAHGVRVLSGLSINRTRPDVLEANRGRLERSVRVIFADETEGLAGRFRSVRGAVDGLGVLAAIAILVGDDSFGGWSLGGWFAAACGVAGVMVVAVHAAWSVRSGVSARRLLSGSQRVVEEYEQRYLEQVARAVADFEPHVVIYLDAFEPTYYTLYQWSDVFEALDQRVLVITARVQRDLPKPIGLPVLFVRDQETAVDLLPASVRGVFYITDAVYNAMFMRKATAKHLVKHVFLNHGDSDKAVNSQVTMRLYDQVWVAGQMAVDRFERNGVWIADEVFRKIGRPQASRVIAPGPRAQSAGDRSTILYAPTWESFTAPENYSSLLSIGRALADLVAMRDDLDLVFRPHPATGTADPRYATVVDEIRSALAGRSRYAPSEPIFELFNDADLLITDVSSVANDFLLTGKPYVMWIPERLDADRVVDDVPTARGAYVVHGPSDLPESIHRALSDDPQASARASVREYCMEDPPEGGQRRFQSLVDELCAEVDAVRARRTHV